MPAWTEKDSMFHNAGDVTGDAQAGCSYNRRWWHQNQNGEFAVLDVTTYPVYAERDEIDPDPKRLVLGVTVDYNLCTDLDDPGGPETWSDMMCATVGEELGIPALADVAAKVLLESIDPARLGWCGHAHRVDYQDVQAYCRVASGALYAKSIFGEDWRSKVNAETVDVDHDYRCPLAQLGNCKYASFETMMSELELTGDDCVRLGFYPSSEVRRPDDVDYLNNHWRRLINAGKE